MSVCFKSFDVSHDFLKNAALVHVVLVNLTIYHSMYEPNQTASKQFKRVKDEEQLLRIFRSLYFEIKCSNNKKDALKFFFPKTFLPLKVYIIILIGL